MNSSIQSESEKITKEDPQTYSITLTAEQRKLLMYSGFAIAGYLLAKHLVKSAVRQSSYA